MAACGCCHGPTVEGHLTQSPTPRRLRRPGHPNLLFRVQDLLVNNNTSSFLLVRWSLNTLNLKLFPPNFCQGLCGGVLGSSASKFQNHRATAVQNLPGPPTAFAASPSQDSKTFPVQAKPNGGLLVPAPTSICCKGNGSGTGLTVGATDLVAVLRQVQLGRSAQEFRPPS